MELIDSHCHLYLSAFAEDIDTVIQRAMAAGVSRFYLPAIDQGSEEDLFALEMKYPGICFAMQGLHPCSVMEEPELALRHVEQSLVGRSFAAVGETGLDFYWDRKYEKQQYHAFRQQIEWALHLNLPVVIHSRESIGQTISVIREHQKGGLRGVFHCFNEDEDSARQIIDLGFHMGIGGTLTYKNSKLPALIKKIGLKNILLETDSPYLPPVPFRGKRNESSYLVYIVQKLAEVLGIPSEEIAQQTTDNGLRLFQKQAT
jgi:TatD DNase family protein